MRVRMAFARLPSILNLKLVHKCGDLKVFLFHNLISVIFLLMVAVSVIMAAMDIVREEFSEKIDEVTSRNEVTSQGDPWEKPNCEAILDLTFDAE